MSIKPVEDLGFHQGNLSEVYLRLLYAEKSYQEGWDKARRAVDMMKDNLLYAAKRRVLIEAYMKQEGITREMLEARQALLDEQPDFCKNNCVINNNEVADGCPFCLAMNKALEGE